MLGDLLRVKIREKWAIIVVFRCSKILAQARNFTTNVPKILDVKSSSEQIFSENCRWVPLIYKAFQDRLTFLNRHMIV